MLSLILTSRVKGNKDSNIFNMLDSLVACGARNDNIEVLVKYDSDDDEQPSMEQFNGRYPFKITKFCWSRGEGRHGIHLDHFYMFSKHDPRATHVMLCADDFTFIRPGFIDDIISIKDPYCFIGPNKPRTELYCHFGWRNENIMNVWKHNEGMLLPCTTVKTIEVLQNYGWQCNGDNWQTLLVLLMWDKYKIDMWRSTPQFFARNPSDGTSGYSATYNEMEIDGSRNPLNPYYFTLVEQQAKNLYLNITHG